MSGAKGREGEIAPLPAPGRGPASFSERVPRAADHTVQEIPSADLHVCASQSAKQALPPRKHLPLLPLHTYTPSGRLPIFLHFGSAGCALYEL